MLKERLEDVFPSHWFSLLLTPTLLPREHGPGLLQNSLHHYSRKKNMRPNIVAWYMVEFHSIYLDLSQMLTNAGRGRTRKRSSVHMVYKTLYLMKLKALKAVFLVAPLPVYRMKLIFTNLLLDSLRIRQVWMQKMESSMAWWWWGMFYVGNLMNFSKSNIRFTLDFLLPTFLWPLYILSKDKSALICMVYLNCVPQNEPTR